MKKSIKYAGIAAATLLAVAPVAAPVVSSVSETTVKADTTDANTSNMNAYAGQFVNSTLSQTQQDALLPVGKFGKMTLDEFNKGYLQFAPYKLNDNDATLKALSSSDTAKATATVSAVTSKGTKISSATELDNYLNDTTTKAVTITVTFNYNDTNSTAATAVTKTFTVTKAAAVQQKTADLTSAAISYDKSLNVSYNTSAADYGLVASANFSVKDNNGNVLTSPDKNGKTAIRTTLSGLYTSYNDAYNDAYNGAKDGQTVNDVPFNEENTTYYQVVTGTVEADPAFTKLLTNFEENTAKYGLTVNGTTPTGNYNDPTSLQIHTNGDEASITVIREIHVGSKEAASWTTTHTSGVVTTKSASNYYTLVNNENQPVGNRALGKDSAWLTDQYRVNNNGVKQYRVATGEWIDANNVTFSDKATTPSDNSALTDIQNQNGTVTLDAPASFNYLLYTKSGELGNRALSGDSAWKVIQTAKDSKGRTYYRVSTTEWVMEGNGVHFTAE